MNDSAPAVPQACAWHGTRLAAFLQDGGRVAVVASSDAAARTAVLDAALRLIAWPVITTGNPLTSPLTLYRLLIQVGAEDDGGDEAECLIRFLAGRSAGPNPLVLLVNDAHTLADDVVQTLAQVMRPERTDGTKLALILSGGPVLQAMLAAPGTESLSDPSHTLVVDVPANGFDPPRVDGAVPKPPSAAPAVPLPPTRAAQVVEPPMARGIVQIPLPPRHPSVIADHPPARPAVQIPMPPASPAPARPPPAEPPAPISPIWARPFAEPPTPPAAAPAAAVHSAELVAAPTPIDEHIMGVRLHIDQNRGTPAHRIGLSIAATLVAAAAGAGAVMVWRARATPPAPAMLASPIPVPQPPRPPVQPAAPAMPPPAPLPLPAPAPPPVPAKPPPTQVPPAVRPLPRAAPRPADPAQRPASANEPGLY